MTTSNLHGKTRHLYRYALPNIENSIEEGLFSPVFALINPLPSALPFGGRYEGLDELRRYMSELSKNIHIESFQVEGIIVENQTVVVVGHEESQIIASGGRYSMDWVHILTFDDEGRYASLREYNDTAQMLDAMIPPSAPQTERSACAN